MGYDIRKLQVNYEIKEDFIKRYKQETEDKKNAISKENDLKLIKIEDICKYLETLSDVDKKYMITRIRKSSR